MWALALAAETAWEIATAFLHFVAVMRALSALIDIVASAVGCVEAVTRRAVARVAANRVVAHVRRRTLCNSELALVDIVAFLGFRVSPESVIANAGVAVRGALVALVMLVLVRMLPSVHAMLVRRTHWLALGGLLGSAAEVFELAESVAG